MKLKDKILYCLNKDEQSRNSDVRLTQAVWVNFHRDRLFANDQGELCVKIHDLFELPREDNIKRIRATIQNNPQKPQFLPTSYEVRRQRGILEQTWRAYLGYLTENPATG